MAKVKEFYADVEYEAFPDEEYDDDVTLQGVDCCDDDAEYYPDELWADIGVEFPFDDNPVFARTKKAS